MRVNYFEEADINENYIDIHYNSKDAEIDGIMNYFNSYQAIFGKRDDIQVRIMISEIYYCEIVDRKCYVYLEKEVYQIDLNIQSLLDRFSRNGLVRIGKSMIVNIYKIKKIKMDLNMKVQIFLLNKETVILNRTYKKEFMEYLKKWKEVSYESN